MPTTKSVYMISLVTLYVLKNNNFGFYLCHFGLPANITTIPQIRQELPTPRCWASGSPLMEHFVQCGSRKPRGGHPLSTFTLLDGLCEQQLPPCSRKAIPNNPFLFDLVLRVPHASLGNLTTLGGRCYNQGHDADEETKTCSVGYLFKVTVPNQVHLLYPSV